ncbi:valine--pyruvate transaminase [Psychromonas sp. psych-6C06]|uniref:valine--pyruvate transaminase n=1 Tax=Psychromonas sp. psych-6C06 TaxID=2058089 RepID=UPI000C32B606|nr:valine--pyruvate transaminase [Psychromonas sp. psych-6C06]PKF60734.1 valine--pyruvate transaminase [Psychromonas sp. psych-6C06]
MPYSIFGNKFTQHSGITELMDDLNAGVQGGDDILMLGGGNPASIPAINDRLTELMQQLLSEGNLINTLANYDGPQGKNTFIDALATLFNDLYDWDLSSENIMLTNGSQNAFFYLFNLLGGNFSSGKKKKILFPLAPEYIGYADASVSEDAFVAVRPKISELDNGLFKYNVDFDALSIDKDIGAICVSRPTNPTGNVLTDEEIVHLDQLAQDNNIPLIIDNAYGTPFPNIIFEEVTPFWNSNTILCLSLSKFGLPGARCGIVIANPAIIKAMSNLSGIMALSPGGIGPEITLPLVKTKEILTLSNEVIKPFYYKKSQQAITLLQEKINTPNFKIHKAEGALFLWLWFKDLPISSNELYKRLKAKGLLIVSGHYFFPGLDQQWPHTQQCIRLNYAQDDDVVLRGVEILAQEINELYKS